MTVGTSGHWLGTWTASGTTTLALSCFALVKGHFPRVSRQSRLSANDKGDNEIIPGAVHRYPGIYLTAEEIPGKPQLGDSRRRLC